MTAGLRFGRRFAGALCAWGMLHGLAACSSEPDLTTTLSTLVTSSANGHQLCGKVWHGVVMGEGETDWYEVQSEAFAKALETSGYGHAKAWRGAQLLQVNRGLPLQGGATSRPAAAMLQDGQWPHVRKHGGTELDACVAALKDVAFVSATAPTPQDGVVQSRVSYTYGLSGLDGVLNDQAMGELGLDVNRTHEATATVVQMTDGWKVTDLGLAAQQSW